MSVDIIQEMVSAGDQEISTIQTRLADLDTQIARCQNELEVLQQEREQRQSAKEDADATVARLDTDYQQAMAYAKLAHKKPNEQQAIKAVSTAKKALDAAKKEQARLEQEDKEAFAAEQVRQEEIATQLHLLQQEKETRHAEMRNVQAGRDKAHTELGAETCAYLLKNYQDTKRRVDELQEQLIAAQVEQHDQYEAALEKLAPWEELQRAFACIKAPEDSTSRLIASTILYIEAILRDVKEVREEMPPDFKRRGLNHWDALIVHRQDMFEARWRRPQVLQRQLDYLQQLQNEYCTYLATDAK